MKIPLNYFALISTFAGDRMSHHIHFFLLLKLLFFMGEDYGEKKTVMDRFTFLFGVYGIVSKQGLTV